MLEITEQKQGLSSYAIGGMVFLALVIIGLIYAGWWLSVWLEDEQRAPLNQIVVTGQRVQIQDQEIEQTIRTGHPESFFEIDVSQVHREIEALPWVYRASIRKRWPNSLNVHVVEQIASAKWNKDWLLNQFGQSFAATLNEPALPSLFGPGGSEKTALQGYRAMQSLLNTTELAIAELYLSDRFAWNLTLNNGIRLNLGRSEFVDRLQRFVDVYPLLKRQDKAIEYVDLRYDTGLAVGWKTNDKTQQES